MKAGLQQSDDSILDSLINLDEIDQRLKRIQDRTLQIEQLEADNKSDREWVLLQLQLSKLKNLESRYGKVSRFSTTRVKFIEGFKPIALPSYFQTVSADTKRIKEALDSGKEIEGCYLESTESIRVSRNKQADKIQTIALPHPPGTP